MKIIYGSSSQKSIGRNQRFTNRERRKRRERNHTTAKTSLPDAALFNAAPQVSDEWKTTQNTVLSSTTLPENEKSIPHEISLIKVDSLPDSENVMTDSQVAEEKSKGVNQNEHELQSPDPVFECAQAQTQTSSPDGDVPSERTDDVESSAFLLSEEQHVSGDDERGRGIEVNEEADSACTEVILEAESSEEAEAADFSESSESVGEASVLVPNLVSENCETEQNENISSENTEETASEMDEMQENRKPPVGSIVFWNESGEESSSASASSSSRSPEGRAALHRLTQILRSEVNLYEILLPATHEHRLPIVVFLHEETSKEEAEPQQD